MNAEVDAREMGKLSLGEALELLALIAFKDPRRHGRGGARWLRRCLEQNPAAGPRRRRLHHRLSLCARGTSACRSPRGTTRARGAAARRMTRRPGQCSAMHPDGKPSR
jgi:hypothetical protein